MTEERRHELDPHPPLGMVERRHCADHECMQARQAWYEDTLLPKLQNMFWRGIAVTVISMSGALFFIVSALIDQHTLEVERAYEATYVKIGAHKDDITRIEKKVDSLESSVMDSLQDVTEKLDRNYEQIRTRPK